MQDQARGSNEASPSRKGTVISAQSKSEFLPKPAVLLLLHRWKLVTYIRSSLVSNCSVGSMALSNTVAVITTGAGRLAKLA